MDMLSDLNGLGPVLYDQVPDEDGAKKELYNALYHALMRYDSSWEETTWQLDQDALGQPRLRSSNLDGPSISYSHGAGRLYGAMTGMGHVGCDYSAKSDFKLNYPVGQAFLPEEWGRALDTHEEPESAAALLWSVKEAVVKALGTGFHYYDPLEFEVELLDAHANGYYNIVRAQKTYVVWSTAMEEGWFSLAVVRRQTM